MTVTRQSSLVEERQDQIKNVYKKVRMKRSQSFTPTDVLRCILQQARYTDTYFRERRQDAIINQREKITSVDDIFQYQRASLQYIMSTHTAR